MVKDQDVVLATLGATTALAGFTLVFLGVIITRYEETIPAASARVRGRFRGPAGGLLFAFLLGLCAIAVSFGWLVARAGQTFYVVVVVLFWLQLLSTALASAYVTRGLLLAK